MLKYSGLANTVLIFFKGAFAVGKISDEERFDVVRHACPGAGACGGMYTANTMSSALEVSILYVIETRPGLAICRFLACPCLTPQALLLRILVRKLILFLVFCVYASFCLIEKVQECVRAAGYLKNLLALDLKPRFVI